MSRYWYAYNGIGDPLSPASYNISTLIPNCINGFYLCAIYVKAVAPFINPPYISNNIRTYIANLQLTLIAQPYTSGAKKYVYGKN